MAQPTAYVPNYDFSDFQSTNPSDPLPGDRIDVEFANLQITTDSIRVNLALIQRDDGELANSSVTIEALDSAVRVLIGTDGWLPRGAWVTATAYAVSDAVANSGVPYVCVTAHTSGVFATDLAAGKWMALSVDGQGTAANEDIGTSGANVPLMSTANTWSAAQVISLTAAGTAFTVQSTDAGASAGPSILIDRFSASPAASDAIGSIVFRGRDSAAVATDYAAIQASIGDATDGSEDVGYLLFRGMHNGSMRDMLGVSPGYIYMTYTDAGASVGPTFDLFRSSSSPAASDVIGEVQFSGNDSGGGTDVYGTWQAVILDPTAASEDGELVARTILAGTEANRLHIAAGVYTTNASGGDKGIDTINATTLYEAGVSLAAKYAPISSSTALPRGYIDGCTMSNGTDAVNDIDIAAGVCRDSANAADITVAAITKRLDAAWAVGTGNGGLDTGAVGGAAWYYVFAIKSSSAVVDVLFSLSFASPTMPGGYSIKRRIGAFYWDASTIRGFVQRGDYFQYKTAVEDVDSSALSTSRTLYVLSAPVGLRCVVHARMNWSHGSSALTVVQCPDETDAAPSASAVPGVTGTPNAAASEQHSVLTNASSQIAARSSQTNTTIRVHTYAYEDLRGKEGLG